MFLLIKSFANFLGISHKSHLYKLNFLVRAWLLGLLNDKSKYIQEILKNYNESPFWIRIFGEIPSNTYIGDLGRIFNKEGKLDERCGESLDPVLKLFDIGGMVIGHTPQFFYGDDKNSKIINGACNGKLWRVDVGSSFAFRNFDPDKNNLREAQVLEFLMNVDKEPIMTLIK